MRGVERAGLADGDLGLQELAAVAGYSPAHFLRLFRRAFGQTPHQFVLDLRIERAKRLLRADGQSLAEIAGSCGFADQSHFGSAFARRAGMPPGRYRETASVSNTTDYQARRLSIRFRENGSPQTVHTLNGTAVVDRMVLAILENFQGDVPDVLRDFGAPEHVSR